MTAQKDIENGSSDCAVRHDISQEPDMSEDARCYICREDFAGPLTDPEVVHAKECPIHVVHRHCLSQWLRIERSCPVCKESCASVVDGRGIERAVGEFAPPAEVDDDDSLGSSPPRRLRLLPIPPIFVLPDPTMRDICFEAGLFEIFADHATFERMLWQIRRELFPPELPDTPRAPFVCPLCGRQGPGLARVIPSSCPTHIVHEECLERRAGTAPVRRCPVAGCGRVFPSVVRVDRSALGRGPLKR